MYTPPPPSKHTAPDIRLNTAIYQESVSTSKYNVGFKATSTWSTLCAFDSTLDDAKIVSDARQLGYPIPNKMVILDARLAIGELRAISSHVKKVNATEDGGILIEFIKDDVFHMLDIYNDEETILVRGGELKLIEHISRNFKVEFSERLV